MKSSEIKRAAVLARELAETLSPLEAYFQSRGDEKNYTQIWAVIEMLYKLEKQLPAIDREIFG